MIKRLLRGWYWILILIFVLIALLASCIPYTPYAGSIALPQSWIAPLRELRSSILEVHPEMIFNGTPTPSFTPTIFMLSISRAEFFTTSTPSSTPYKPIPPTATHTLTPTPTATFTPTPTNTNTPVPTATDTPIPVSNPPVTDPGTENPGTSVYISGVPGHNMYYSLDCETRSSVDLAAFFGVSIDHQQFLNNLPYTDDPETGYVGSYKDPSGSIPPYSYGVHSPPIASLLNQYGLPAQSRKGMSLDELKAELNAGRPVMVWVIGSVLYGTPQTYTASSTGNTTIVAAYEHTVLVVGYDDYYIYIQDGYNAYYRSQKQFEASWGVLGNMAVTVSK